MSREIKFNVLIKEESGEILANFYEWLEDGIWWNNCYKPDLHTNGTFYANLLPDLKGEIIRRQYTGLKDKKGVEIYEGDVLFINRIGDYPINQTHSVIYNTDFATFATDVDRTFDWMRYGGKIEVIGNIHTNPRLLKELK